MALGFIVRELLRKRLVIINGFSLDVSEKFSEHNFMPLLTEINV